MIFSEDFYSSIICKECFNSKKQTELFFQQLFDLLFQTGGISIISKEELNSAFKVLKKDLKLILEDAVHNIDEVDVIANGFFDKIPEVYDLLIKDAEYISDSDPAANSAREVEVAYPGFFAIAAQRFAHIFYKYNIPFLPRVMTEYAHHKTGVDIHPGAKIGSPFMIDHGTGIVIGESSVIGNYVKIFQGVTLGALSVTKDKQHTDRHPKIEDHVVIYAGATILGGDTTIGEHSVIGGNVWLTESVEPGSKVFHKSQIVVKGKEVKNQPINFVI